MKSKFLFKTLAVLSVSSVLCFHSCGEDESNSLTNNNISTYDTEIQKYVKKYEIVRLDYPALEKIAKEKPSGFVDVNLNIPSKPHWNFQLTTENLDDYKTSDFAAYSVIDEQTAVKVQTPENYALKGKLAQSNSDSYFLFGAGQLQGSIVDKGEEYYIEPVSNYSRNVEDNLYVIYNVSDLYPINTTSDFVENPENKDTQPKILGNSKNPWQVEVTMLGDYQLFLYFRDFNETYNYLFARNFYTNVRHIKNNTSARTIIKKIYVLSDPKTKNFPPNARAIENNLEPILVYNNYDWYDNGDINYFITGDKIVGKYVGYAYIGNICINAYRAFGIGQYYPAGTLANILMAHETGHSMGLKHDELDPKLIMSPQISEATVFSDKSKSKLQSTLNNQSGCLNY